VSDNHEIDQGQVLIDETKEAFDAVASSMKDFFEDLAKELMPVFVPVLESMHIFWNEFQYAVVEAKARYAYKTAGSPYGETEQGFTRWLVTKFFVEEVNR